MTRSMLIFNKFNDKTICIVYMISKLEDVIFWIYQWFCLISAVYEWRSLKLSKWLLSSLSRRHSDLQQNSTKTSATCQDDIKSSTRSWSTSRYLKVQIQCRRNYFLKSHSFRTRSLYKLYQSESHSQLSYVDQSKRDSELRKIH